MQRLGLRDAVVVVGGGGRAEMGGGRGRVG